MKKTLGVSAVLMVLAFGAQPLRAQARPVGVDVTVSDWLLQYQLQDWYEGWNTWYYDNLFSNEFLAHYDLQLDTSNFCSSGCASCTRQVMVDSENDLIYGTRSVYLHSQADGHAGASSWGSQGGAFAQCQSIANTETLFSVLRPMRYDLFMVASGGHNVNCPGCGKCKFGTSGTVFFEVQDDLFFGEGILSPLTSGHYVLRCDAFSNVSAKAPGGSVTDQHVGAGYSYFYELVLTPLDAATIIGFDGTTLEWEAAGWPSWNVYRGDMAAFRSQGEITQVPGSHPAAAQFCGVSSPIFTNSYDPLPGEAALWLVLGTDGTTEEEPGYGRTNTAPCP